MAPSTTGASRPRSGRRPGRSGTRQAILDAARRQFAAKGYDRTSLRSVAADARVDPALIVHFFGSKRNLFLAVVELPVDPRAVVPALLERDRGAIGEGVARIIVALLEDPEGRRKVLGLLRAATSEPEIAVILRDFLMGAVWGPLADALGVEDARLRVNLVASQLVGLVMVREVLNVEPIASLSADELVEVVAPMLQRCLTGPLTT